nr:MAG TPA: hypothetical protein [Caudoviricetes sp.]
MFPYIYISVPQKTCKVLDISVLSTTLNIIINIKKIFSFYLYTYIL